MRRGARQQLRDALPGAYTVGSSMFVSRRHFLQGGLALPVLAAEKPVVVAPRPNVLLMIADDLPAWVLGCYGNKEVRTPSLDRLAQVGTRFLNHVACAPAPEWGAPRC